MKILLINDYGTLNGGAEIQTVALQKHLVQRGHDVRFFSSSAHTPGLSSQADYECLGTLSKFRTLLQTINPWAFRKLKAVLSEFRPDVVHVKLFLTQLSPLILGLLKDFPSLYHVVWYRPVCPIGTKILPDQRSCTHSFGVACYRERCLPLHDWLPLMLQMKLWYQQRQVFDRIVANSEATRQQLLAGGIQPVEVIWNGIPENVPRRPLSVTPKAVFAGRLVPEKGVDILLQAFQQIVAELPKAQLIIVGDGEERDRLHQLIHKLELNANVSMTGFLPREVMQQQFADAWVQVVPSRWAEPFGLVAVEAMMRSTAVIASNAGGLAEIVQPDRTGLLVPPQDVAALAEALRSLLGNRTLAEQMGQRGREVAIDHFSETAFANRFLELYEELITSNTKHL